VDEGKGSSEAKATLALDPSAEDRWGTVAFWMSVVIAVVERAAAIRGETTGGLCAAASGARCAVGAVDGEWIRSYLNIQKGDGDRSLLGGTTA
jgi:hypothetical protein